MTFTYPDTRDQAAFDLTPNISLGSYVSGEAVSPLRLVFRKQFRVITESFSNGLGRIMLTLTKLPRSKNDFQHLRITLSCHMLLRVPEDERRGSPRTRGR